MNVKKIVTEVHDDGKFLAADLADWIKEQNFYSVTEIKSNGETKLLYYEFNMDIQDSKNVETGSITKNWGDLVLENDIIKLSDSTMERVVSVVGEGSFFAEVSKLYF